MKLLLGNPGDLFAISTFVIMAIVLAMGRRRLDDQQDGGFIFLGVMLVVTTSLYAAQKEWAALFPTVLALAFLLWILWVCDNTQEHIELRDEKP